MGSGDCVSDILNSDKIFAKLSEWEILVNTNETNFRSALNISLSDPLSIKLVNEDQGWRFYDPDRNTRFNLTLQ